MTVKELMEILAKANPDDELLAEGDGQDFVVTGADVLPPVPGFSEKGIVNIFVHDEEND